MRFRTHDRFWGVVNPTPNSILSDVVFESSLAGLKLQFDGGLSLDAEPTLYDTEEAARRDATARLLAAKLARGIAATPHDLSHVRKAQLFDREGRLQAEIEVSS
ncbi:MAG: hypothetical protein ACT4PE_17085 [Candidatus Eiseniibacteriota bacterium]